MIRAAAIPNVYGMAAALIFIVRSLRNNKFNDNRCSEYYGHKAGHSTKADCRIQKIVSRLFIDVLAGIFYVFHGKPPDTFDTSSIPNIAFCCKAF
jgi:hypothetical protein